MLVSDGDDRYTERMYGSNGNLVAKGGPNLLYFWCVIMSYKLIMNNNDYKLFS